MHVHVTNAGSAREFLWTAKSLRLPMSCDNDAFVSKQTEDPRLLKFGMNTKKSHEVEGMSRLVADMASRLKVNQVFGHTYVHKYIYVTISSRGRMNAELHCTHS